MRPIKLKIHTEDFTPDVDDILRKLPDQQRKRIAHLEDVLTRRYKAQGHKDADAKQRAASDVDTLIRAALMDFSDGYIGGKTKTINRLFELQQEVFGVYDAVLSSAGKKIDVDIPGLHAKYTEISRLFDELKITPKQAIAKTDKGHLTPAANRVKITPTPVPAGTTVAHASERLKGLVGRKGWKKLPDGTVRAKLSNGTVDLIEVDGIIHVTWTQKGKDPVVFKEFDTLADPYRLKPRSTRVIQAHHGCQDALMKMVFGKHGYDGAEAPTIWLRDSTGESPHGIITHAMQNPNLAARADTPGLSYGMIRDWAVADLKAAGAPDDSIRAYLRVMDAHFTTNIEPSLQLKGKMRLKGEIKVY